jgi:isochorismate synthase EntC
VQHLGTRMEGWLSQPAPSVLEMARALSPTPALGGHPRKEALNLIAAVEGMDRGRYGGAVGWLDADGNGTFAVAIRCAEIQGTEARLFAGGGIVAESDPLAELAETQAKFQAMISAIIRP